MNNQYNSFRSLRIEVTEYDPYLLDNAATQAEIELGQRLETFDPKRGAYIGCEIFHDVDEYETALRETLADELAGLAANMVELEIIEAFVLPLMP